MIGGIPQDALLDPAFCWSWPKPKVILVLSSYNIWNGSERVDFKIMMMLSDDLQAFPRLFYY